MAYALDTRDGNSVTLMGSISDIKDYSFILNSIDDEQSFHQIKIEVDDNTEESRTDLLRAGDVVTVSGKIDNDPLEKPKLEAARIYVVRTGDFIFASPKDEEDTFIPPDTYYRPSY